MKIAAPTNRVRTSFDTELELPKLYKWFAENPHPSRLTLQVYVRELNSSAARKSRKLLEVHNLCYWFKNARAAYKRAELRMRKNHEQQHSSDTQQQLHRLGGQIKQLASCRSALANKSSQQQQQPPSSNNGTGSAKSNTSSRNITTKNSSSSSGSSGSSSSSSSSSCSSSSSSSSSSKSNYNNNNNDNDGDKGGTPRTGSGVCIRATKSLAAAASVGSPVKRSSRISSSLFRRMYFPRTQLMITDGKSKDMISLLAGAIEPTTGATSDDRVVDVAMSHRRAATTAPMLTRAAASLHRSSLVPITTVVPAHAPATMNAMNISSTNASGHEETGNERSPRADSTTHPAHLAAGPQNCATPAAFSQLEAILKQLAFPAAAVASMAALGAGSDTQSVGARLELAGALSCLLSTANEFPLAAAAAAAGSTTAAAEPFNGSPGEIAINLAASLLKQNYSLAAESLAAEQSSSFDMAGAASNRHLFVSGTTDSRPYSINQFQSLAMLDNDKNIDAHNSTSCSLSSTMTSSLTSGVVVPPIAPLSSRIGYLSYLSPLSSAGPLNGVDSRGDDHHYGHPNDNRM